jgi:hypothetical protein
MFAVIPAPLLLGSCMMLGMGGMGAGGGGGMHGASHDSSMNSQTLVKESVVKGIQITVEFPPYVLGDTLTYKVTLRHVRDRSYIANASMELIVTSDDNQNEVGTVKTPPAEIANGTYVFRPSITRGGAYKFVFVLNRVGSAAEDPPIEVEQRIQLNGPMDGHSGNADRATGFRIVPATVIGAGVMAIMMLVMLR